MFNLLEKQARGTRIINGEEARNRRILLNQLIEIADKNSFEEIILPSLELSGIYTEKAGEEVLNQMYTFDGKGENPDKYCLRPEGTATIQLIADKYFPQQKDVKFWYFEKCWRYERNQRGRYREFWQFGLEWLNPRNANEAKDTLIKIAKQMVSLKTTEHEVADNAKRGLQYYVSDGFEISCPQLGAQKQVVGGGTYKQGIGFGLGFCRLMLCE